MPYRCPRSIFVHPQTQLRRFRRGEISEDQGVPDSLTPDGVSALPLAATAWVFPWSASWLFLASPHVELSSSVLGSILRALLMAGTGNSCFSAQRMR